MTLFAVLTTAMLMFIMRGRTGLPLVETFTLPVVYGSAFFALPAALSILHRKLRWIQVATFLLVGFATAYASAEPSLTPATWTMVGLLLAWQYGLFNRQPSVRAAVVLTIFVLLWSSSVLRGDIPVLSSINLLGAGVLLFFVVWTIVIFRAREARRRADELESMVSSRTAALTQALSEKNTLIREIHHQTKNNLQMIAATLSFEADAHPEGISQENMNLISSRIHMLGRIQEQMLASEPIGMVELSEFVEQNIVEIHSIVDARGGRVKSDQDVSGVVTSEVAMQLGYVLVEVGFVAALLANQDSHVDDITISCRSDQQDGIRVVLSSPAPEELDDTDEKLQLGAMIVRSIVERIGGSADFTRTPADEIHWSIAYPLHGPSSR